MKLATVASLAAFLAATGAAAQKVVDLSTANWTLSSAAHNISVPAKLPSHAHLDLHAAGVIQDPYFGRGEYNLRWVGYSNWTYTSEGITGLSKKKGTKTWLLFHGLDTFSSIEFCGEHVAATNNQFRQYYFDVTKILRGCDSDAPELSIEFGAAPNITKAIAEEPDQETWPSGVEQLYVVPNRQFMRKEQSDFGWDWGPAFSPAGPWKPAYAIQLAASEIYVRNTLVDIYREGQMNNRIPGQSKPWVVNASLDYLGTLPETPQFLYEIKDMDNKTVSSGALKNITSRAGSITGQVTIPGDSMKLWWPLGFGPQDMYYMDLKVQSSKDDTLARVTKRVGFRTIVVNMEEVTQAQQDLGIAPGANWHFEINGHEFFAKGANLIPPDAFWPRVTVEKMENLLGSVAEANMNMLRVWSSGAYLPDFMYDIADEKGVLLWSEFQFGDALYPVDAEFLDNVFQEAEYNVRRVNHHPSLAFWAGGNELENLELSIVNGSGRDNYVKYKGEYETLFLSTLFPAIFENSHSISYSPSSTSNGFISLNFTDAPYFQQRYESTRSGWVYGLSDYYNYFAGSAFSYQNYPKGRFANEFGYHSMPSLQTWQQALTADDLNYNASTIVIRNHHYVPEAYVDKPTYQSMHGMSEMTEAVKTWYPTPHQTNSVANFSAWCHSTQIFQADYYTSQIKTYRLGSGRPERNLGSLYWQLEDIWQAPTWAGIEYDGRWKVLHYRAKDIYSNVIISPFFDSYKDGLDLWVTSDLWESINGTVTAKWFTWSGKHKAGIKGLDAAPVQVGALNTTRVYSGNTAVLLQGVKPKNVVMKMTVTAEGHLPNSQALQTFTHTSWFHPVALKDANLVDPGLKLTYSRKTKKFTVTATKGVAAWVWVDYPPGAVVSFDDNGFWLGKGESKELGYKVKTDNTLGAWIEGVTVRSLWDNTQP